MKTREMFFVVGLFGVMSAVLGFLAEANKLTPADIHVSGTKCVYPVSSAYSLAVGAILLLVVSQITASVASSCCGRRCRPGGDDDPSKMSTRRVAGVVVFALSWIAAAVAGAFYWIGAAWNADQTRDVTFTGREEECLFVKDGVFTSGAVLSLVATTLALLSCILLRAPPAATAEPVAGAADEFKPDGQHRPPESGVAVELPPWPAQGCGQTRV